MKSKIALLGFAGILIFMLAFIIKPDNNQKIIVIDAGHGGDDPGATFDGKHEKIITENIAANISRLNNKKDLKIILLREGDQSLSVKDRANQINKIKPDLLISIHAGASGNPELNGINAQVSPKNIYYTQSRQLAKEMMAHLEGLPLANGKVIDTERPYIISSVNCPAILLDAGFISNEKDRKYISSEAGQKEIAGRIYQLMNR